MNEQTIRRGDVWWIAFDPAVGGEVKKTRPAIIVSNDASNRHLARFQVVPLTSNVKKLYAGEVFVTLQNGQSKAKANQLVTVSKIRVRNYIGTISTGEMKLVDTAIREQLDL